MSNLFREGDRWVPSDGIETDEITDGHHTFRELYDHRRALTAVLASAAASAGDSWRSKAHHPEDNPIFEGGYFIVGIELPTGTITYHYKLKHWDDFAAVPELEHAPKWDGAAPEDTVIRCLELARMVAGSANTVQEPADLPCGPWRGLHGCPEHGGEFVNHNPGSPVYRPIKDG